MKVIVTGSTGNVGGAVLDRCIAHPQITSVVALTRRPLEIKNSKLNNIVLRNFLEYDQATLSELSGAQACIWALGTPTSGPEVHNGYTMAAVNAFKESLVPKLGASTPFRLIYTSGGAVPFLDSSALFFLGSGRKYRGDIERDVCKLNAQMNSRWESVVVRPWFVLHDEQPNMVARYLDAYIRRTVLAAAMVDAALNGSETQILTNADCRLKGAAAMKEVG